MVRKLVRMRASFVVGRGKVKNEKVKKKGRDKKKFLEPFFLDLKGKF